MLYRWHKGKSYFVVRLKDFIKFNRLEEKELPDNRHQYIPLGDKQITLGKQNFCHDVPIVATVSM
ncbi:MAG: hypothetical protein ACLFPH_05320 [Bacteroidales bacterium]